MPVYSTEIASEVISSDNPIHQRLLKAYYLARPFVKGSLLEVGCGEGRGVSLLAPLAEKYFAVDKIQGVIDELAEKFPDHHFKKINVPPFSGLNSDAFDTLVSFQVIEHIGNDGHFLEEIYRVLKPGGVALLTTPNIERSLSRNPWHKREYTADQLNTLAFKIFDKVEIKGIAGNEKVEEYYQKNKRSVEKITQWDIFNLQYRLPAAMLRIPYEILNRMNRNKLESADDTLVRSITFEDYHLTENPDQSLDLFAILRKS